jgi:branched-chain amino acid transport system permease protein
MTTATATNLKQVPLLKRYLNLTSLILVISLGVMVWLAFAQPSLLVNTLVTGGMWALMAGGLALVFGVMNIPSFVHGDLYMVGTLVALFMFNPPSGWGLPWKGIQSLIQGNTSNPVILWAGPLIGMASAFIVGAVIGVLMELLLFRQLRRRSREQWVMNTFLLTAGVGIIFENSAMIKFGNLAQGISRYWDMRPLVIFGVSVGIDRLMTFVIAMVTLAVFAVFLQRTRTGRAMRAVSMDETGAQMAGIGLTRIYQLTLALSCGLAAMAGAVLLWQTPFIPTVGTGPLLIAWYVVILAGLGNVQGAVVGAFLIALVQQLTGYYIATDWVDVLPTAIIILILLFKPSGLFGSEVKGVWEQ